LTSTEPNLRVDLPDGYRGIELSVYRRALSGSAAQQSDPAAKRDLEATIRLIDTGQIRGIGYGRARTGCAHNVITFRIPPPADSLEAAVAAWREEHEGRSAQYEVMSRKSVRLSVGPAIRILVGVKGRSSGATFGRAIVYLVRLDDGEVVELNGGAPFADTGFDALLDAIAESLRATS
jgi:hypothetical protein